MAVESKVVERAADELYGLPPDEFTRARDERAKELRKAGDREAADAVKALRKPTVAAAAVNRLSRSRSKDVESLLAAGEELQAAQEDLLAGGDRSAFQRAAARERELVAELAAEAGPGLQEKVAATLHAAALDAEIAEELRAGRLVREREAVGGFGFGVPDAPRTTAPRRPRPQQAKPAPASKRKPKPAKAKSRDDSARRERLAAARSEERHARKELEAAAKALRSAQERAEAAEAHAAEAAKRAKTTATRLSEAKHAEAAAKKAHSKAAATLKRAEAAAE